MHLKLHKVRVSRPHNADPQITSSKTIIHLNLNSTSQRVKEIATTQDQVSTPMRKEGDTFWAVDLTISQQSQTSLTRARAT